MQLHDIPPIITLSPLTSHYLAAKLLQDEGIVFDFCGTLDKDFIEFDLPPNFTLSSLTSCVHRLATRFLQNGGVVLRFFCGTLDKDFVEFGYL